MSIERSVDFDDVEESRQKFHGMDFLTRYFRRIENPVPVFVRPAGSPNADSWSRFHTGRPDDGRLAQCFETGSCGAGTLRPRTLATIKVEDRNTQSVEKNRDPVHSRSDTPHCARSRSRPQTGERPDRAAGATRLRQNFRTALGVGDNFSIVVGGREQARVRTALSASEQAASSRFGGESWTSSGSPACCRISSTARPTNVRSARAEYDGTSRAKSWTT